MNFFLFHYFFLNSCLLFSSLAPLFPLFSSLSCLQRSKLPRPRINAPVLPDFVVVLQRLLTEKCFMVWMDRLMVGPADNTRLGRRLAIAHVLYCFNLIRCGRAWNNNNNNNDNDSINIIIINIIKTILLPVTRLLDPGSDETKK